MKAETIITAFNDHACLAHKDLLLVSSRKDWKHLRVVDEAMRDIWHEL
jgi:hypothetical protein